MFRLLLSIALYIIFLSGCKQEKVNIVTYDLKLSDYLETIEARGTIEAVNNFTLVAPNTNYTNLLAISHLAEDGAHVKKGDTICIFDVPELTNTVENYKTALEKMEGDMKKLEADNAMQLALLKAQVETNKARMAISMLDSIQVQFVPQVKQRLLALEMEKTNIEKKRLEKKFAAQKRIDNSELIQMRSRIMMQKNRIQIAQNQVNSLKLVAPVDGIVIHVENYRYEGGTFVFGKIEEGVSTLSGMSVLQIPEMKEMQISLEVPESDYKRIENGQKVLIRVEAAGNLNTTGKIKRKTLAGKNPRELTTIKTYVVIISVDSCHSRLQPGLSAGCSIIVHEVNDTIVVPAAAIFTRDSAKVVYVADGEKFKPVIVETGFSNSSKSIISKGLTGNETIALMVPPDKLITRKEKIIKDTINTADSIKKDTLIKRDARL
jgi:HlyD family secretion protein